MPRRQFVPPAIVVVALFALVPHSSRAADPPIDDLLRLAPPDAVCLVTLENLRDHARRFAGSKVATALARLPTVRAWLESDGRRRFNQARDRVETILGVGIEQIRDDLLGDAVALVLRVPKPGAEPQGLLLAKVRDRGLLARVIERLDQAQKDGGEVEQIVDRKRGGVGYHERVYAAGSGRKSDWYTITEDGVFVISNQEQLVTGVIDRDLAAKSKGSPPSGGFGDSPRLAALRKRLPTTALARLYLDPRRLEPLIPSGDASSQPGERRLLGVLARAVAAVDFAGAALTWDDGSIGIRVCETLDAAKVAPWVKRWAADPRPSNPGLDHIPPEAVAAASIHLDASALRDGLVGLLSPDERSKLEHVEIALGGLLLGQDVPLNLLPKLGPRVVAFVEAPVVSGAVGADKGRGELEIPMAVRIGLAPGAGAAANPVSIESALENALKTVLALATLDEKRGLSSARIVTSEHAGSRITGLDAQALFAFAFDQRGRNLVLGSSRSVVGLALSAKAGDRFGRLAAVGGPAPSFVALDIQALARALASRRGDFARALAARQGRPEKEVDGDLGQVLALARELDAAVLTHAIEPDATAAGQTFRLVLAGAAGTTPQ